MGLPEGTACPTPTPLNPERKGECYSRRMDCVITEGDVIGESATDGFDLGRGGVYVSHCQELEVASCGDTPGEALENIREAIELYLENAREPGMLQDIKLALTVKGPDAAGP
jgi:predicted RNase H-like HicB family nuclease